MPKIDKSETCCGGCFCRFKWGFCNEKCFPQCPECCLDYGSSCMCCYCTCACVPVPCRCIFDKFSPYCCVRGHFPYPPDATIIKECACCNWCCLKGCTCGMRKGCSCTDHCCESCCSEQEWCDCKCCDCKCCDCNCCDFQCCDAYGCHCCCFDCVCPCVPVCCTKLCTCWSCGHHYRKNEDGSYGIDDNSHWYLTSRIRI